MTQEEKTLILGALFHDIGKFEQRCTGNPSRIRHPELGVKLIEDERLLYKFEKIVGSDNIPSLKNIISEHHNPKSAGLTAIVREADRLSASERVDKEEVEVYQDQWSHKHLASLFSKINILSGHNILPRYYKHEHLSKNKYDVIIPSGTTEDEIKDYAYKQSDWNLFKEDLEYVLDIYEDEKDFPSLINLLLVIFEKYMWCIPDFTGSSQTDISLYNHLKDVAGLAHSIYLTQREKKESKSVNLIIGDLPGIQKYIFNVVNRKPAKILRGRSIFVQIITRNLATKILTDLGLTEINLIMLAGGKFYIIAPETDEFGETLRKINIEIEKYLFKEFRMELKFNCAYHTFQYSDLLGDNSPLTFGHLVEEASHKLIQNRYNLYENMLFGGNLNENGKFIWKEEFIKDDGSGTDSMKCRVTDKPIRFNRKDNIKIQSDSGFEEITVDKQVKIEYNIGSKIVRNDVIVILDENSLSIDPDNILTIDEYKKDDRFRNRNKILLNPTITEQLKKENIGKDVFRNTQYLEVANYCSESADSEIMPFEDIARENEGAEFLTLIKGDIDNLGLIMAYGLTSDTDDLTGISRTTTLSNHLKYYFSFFLNGFLSDWEKQKSENKVYTIFAGGDDIMLVTPQSSSVKLVKSLNDTFDEFTCSNNEVHISYSITHFKDHTPIRIVADFAEDSQKEGKNHNKPNQMRLLNDTNTMREAFISGNDKAGTYMFSTLLKNEILDYYIKKVDELVKKADDKESGLSHGLIRKLFEVSEMLKKYEETNDAAYLIGLARLNYTVNRLLKGRDGDIKDFFDKVLIINKEENEESQLIEKILHPLVCQIIYRIRN